MVQVSSMQANPWAHAATQINEAICGSRPSGENPMNPVGTAETTSRFSKSAAITMSSLPQESEGCAALDGPATASQGTARRPPMPTN